MGLGLGVLRGHRPPPVYPGARRAAHNGRALVPGRGAELRGARAPAQGCASRRLVQVRRARTLYPDVRRALRQDGRRRRRAQADGGPSRRPGRRLHAQHPRDPDRVPRRGQPGGDLVELPARVRHPQCRGPFPADRAPGPLRGRRVPVQRGRARPHGPGGRTAARAPDARGHGAGPLPVRGAPGRPPAERPDVARVAGHPWDRGVRLRAGPVRSPVVDRLLLRHHRPAEGDRPGARWDPAGEPQDPRAPSGPPGG